MCIWGVLWTFGCLLSTAQFPCRSLLQTVYHNCGAWQRPDTQVTECYCGRKEERGGGGGGGGRTKNGSHKCCALTLPDRHTDTGSVVATGLLGCIPYMYMYCMYDIIDVVGAGAP